MHTELIKELEDIMKKEHYQNLEEDLFRNTIRNFLIKVVLDPKVDESSKPQILDILREVLNKTALQECLRASVCFNCPFKDQQVNIDASVCANCPFASFCKNNIGNTSRE